MKVGMIIFNKYYLLYNLKSKKNCYTFEGIHIIKVPLAYYEKVILEYE